MSLRIKFTMASLAKLQPSDVRYYTYDASAGAVSGLCLSVTPAGGKAFYLYRKIDGKPVRYRLGTFPELTVEGARKAAIKHVATIAAGGNPQEEKRARREELTLQDLWDWYLERHSKPRLKSWKEEQGLYRRYLSGWSARRLSSISRDEVQKLHQQIGDEHGHTSANHMVSLLCNMFNVANRLNKWTGDNPASGIRKFTLKSRERFLQPHELPLLFAAIDADPNPDMGDFVRLAIFTGARRWNLMSMQWQEIDWNSKVWTIPETKNGEALRVPLAPAAIDILKSRQRHSAGNEHVFPSRHKAGKHPHMVYPHKAWWRICEAAGLKNLRLHDLRRTLGSWQAATGASSYVIGKSLGHKTPQATAIYARLNLDPVRASVGTAVSAMLSAVDAAKEKSREKSDEKGQVSDEKRASVHRDLFRSIHDSRE